MPIKGFKDKLKRALDLCDLAHERNALESARAEVYGLCKDDNRDCDWCNHERRVFHRILEDVL